MKVIVIRISFFYVLVAKHYKERMKKVIFAGDENTHCCVINLIIKCAENNLIDKKIKYLKTVSFVFTGRDEKSTAAFRKIHVNMKVNVIQICSAVCFSCQTLKLNDE